MSAPVRVTAVDRFSARLLPGPSAVEAERKAEIASVWAEALAAKPRMFDGRVLLAERAEIRDGTLEVDFREVGFSTLIWLRAQKFERPPLLNVFGAAAVASSDGAILLGRMAAHTANAGQIYFPAGTPDLSDVVDGIVNLDASTLRELKEETGLAPPVVTPQGRRIVVFDRELVACVRVFRSDFNGAALKAAVERFLAKDPDGELDSVDLVSGEEALTVRSPDYVRAAVRAML